MKDITKITTMKNFKTIADNTQASSLVTDSLAKNRMVMLYNCYENECTQIDLIYMDNGNKECYTLDKTQGNREFRIMISQGEMKTYESNISLEDLYN